MRTWILLLLCAVAAAASADKLYQWVDKDGHVHYSQTPPPASVTNAKAVNVHVDHPDPAVVQAAQQQAAAAARPAPPPPPDPATAAKLQECQGMHAQMSAYTHSDAPMTAERKKAMDDLRAQIAKECN